MYRFILLLCEVRSTLEVTFNQIVILIKKAQKLFCKTFFDTKTKYIQFAAGSHIYVIIYKPMLYKRRVKMALF